MINSIRVRADEGVERGVCRGVREVSKLIPYEAFPGGSGDKRARSFHGLAHDGEVGGGSEKVWVEERGSEGVGGVHGDVAAWRGLRVSARLHMASEREKHVREIGEMTANVNEKKWPCAGIGGVFVMKLF